MPDLSNSLDQPVNTILEAVLDYAREGLPVFPAFGITRAGRCACGKERCRKSRKEGKHPDGKQAPHSVYSATADVNKLTSWNWTARNIALKTGNGLVVIDFDPRNVQDSEAAHHFIKRLPATRTHKTGGGGLHFFFHSHDTPTLRKPDMPAGFDWLADGQYAIVPPSLHKSGLHYTVSDDRDPAPLPTELERRGTPHPSLTTTTPSPTGHSYLWLRRTRRWLKSRFPTDRIPEGRRTNTLLKDVAGFLRGYGLSGSDIVDILIIANATLCDPPLEESAFANFNNWIDAHLPPGHPATEDNRDAYQLICSLRQFAEESQWRGKQGRTAYKVLHVLLDEADIKTSFIVEKSLRDIAKDSGVASTESVRKAIAFLRNNGLDGWIQIVGGGHWGNSFRYHLQVPKSFRLGIPLAIPNESNSLPILNNYMSNVSNLSDPAADQWRSGGRYGPDGLRIYRALHQQHWKSGAELARCLHIASSTVNKKLNQLRDDGAAISNDMGWHVGLSPIVETYVQHDRDEARHDRERIAYRTLQNLP